VDERYLPKDVGPTADGSRLRIRWHDGAVSEYAPWLLRMRCPCARCVDEMTGIRTLTPDSVAPEVYPLAIEYVGRYALRFDWSDGHGTGIYPFDYLRRLAEETDAQPTETPTA